MEKYLQDPKIVAAAAAALILVLVIIIGASLVRGRRRKVAKEQKIRGELAAMERETQFGAAAEQLRYSADPLEAAQEIASLLKEYQSIRTRALYAGKADSLIDVLRTGAGKLTTGELGPSMPNVLSAQAMGSFLRPKLTTVAGLIAAGGPAPRRQEDAAPAPSGPGASDAAAAESAPGASGGLVAPSASVESGSPQVPDQVTNGAAERAAQVPAAESTDRLKQVVVLPWHGPFGWRGLIVGEPEGSGIDIESCGRALETQEEIGNRLAVALEIESARATTGAAISQSARMGDFIRSLPSAMLDRGALPDLTKATAALLEADTTAYWEVDAESRTVKMTSAYGLDMGDFLPVPLGQGFSGRVAESGKALVIENAAADPRCLFPQQARDAGIGSYLGAPVTADGRVLGVLEVHTSHPHSWTDGNIAALQAAAASVGRLSGNRAVAAIRAPAPSLSGVAETPYLRLSEALQGLNSTGEVLEAAVEVLGSALQASRVIYVEFNESAGPIRTQPVKHEYLDGGAPSAIGTAFLQEFVERVIAETKGGAPVAIDDSSQKSLMTAEMAGRLRVSAELAVPVSADGSTGAIFYVHQCGQPRTWGREEVEFANRLGRQAALRLKTLTATEAASKAVEAAREDARRATDVAARARGLIDALPVPVLGLDREGRLTFFNTAGRLKLGLKNEDLGRMAEMTDSLAMVDESIWERINACETVSDFAGQWTTPRTTSPLAAPDRAQKGLKLDGRTAIPVSLAAAPIRDSRGEMTGHILVAIDVSHLAPEAGAPEAGAPAPGAAAGSAQTPPGSVDGEGRAAELRQRAAELENLVAEVRSAEARARARAERAEAALADHMAATRSGTSDEIELQRQLETAQEDAARARKSAQQLLEINRLKSDFIVNAGRELEASLQAVLGFAELLGRGSYGQLSDEQLEAVRGVYSSARRMKSDVDWLVEYGSARSRRLEEK
ncbi:MAG TPA: GAF domain-containing protein [Blastocatellia bacterium]|nr:GAF domain-containing protein [Blastocatellia bacterium]